MQRILADLHIHTALSPCAEREMTPPAIVAGALEKGIAVIAVCDHNSAANAAAVMRAAGALLTVIPGMEITTAEEVHVVGLFPDAGSAESAASEVTPGLPMWKALTSFGPGDSLRKPEQELMDERGTVVGIEERMLASASRFTLSEAVSLIRDHGGIAVAAHVDRRAFSVVGQLGFFPEDVRFDALEISAAGAARGRAAEFASRGLPMVSSSDSHFLSEIGASATALDVEAPCFEELRRALKGDGGRRCGIA
jgi:PHP family Zn ribbon phosphoesterase